MRERLHCVRAGTCDEVADVDGVEDLLAVVIQVDLLSVLKQRVHVLEACFLIGTRIHFTFCLFFALLHLTQPVNWRVVNVLHFIDSDDGEYRPV